MQVEHIPIENLKSYEANTRTHSTQQILEITRSIKNFGFNNPILVDRDNTIIAGHARLQAAYELGLKTVPVIFLHHLDDISRRAYIIADNKLAEKSKWNSELLTSELEALLDLNCDLDLTITGFETPEIDNLLNVPNIKVEEHLSSDCSDVPELTQRGDLWKIGEHYLLCGDCLEAPNFERLMQGNKADLVFTDPPYNVKIDGNVCGKGKVKHKEFSYASGEMSIEAFTQFLEKSFLNLKDFSKNGSIHYICIDWRHLIEITAAGKLVYTELKNLCVWNKGLAGMGSLYRSQHELIFVFKNGDAKHTNNIQLGKYGRNRSNVWNYPGVHISNSHASDIKMHPTVKPISMIADAIRDCSKLGGIVLDCFGGSGSTLFAAEQTKRRAFLMEYEPGYCDVILSRSQKENIKTELVERNV